MTERALEQVHPIGASPMRPARPAPERPFAGPPFAGHELFAVAGRRACAMQTKIEIGPSDDPHERDADRIAEQVMRTPEPGLLRRACACGDTPEPDDECARCSAAGLGLQAKRAAPASATVAPPIVHEVLRSPGAPLDTGTRAFFESRLGADLSGVRVHVDSRASASARAVDALAYTVGDDVVFAERHYAPATNDGQKLLAHELAHVLQQRAGVASLQRQVRPTCNMIPFDPQRQSCCNGYVIPGPPTGFGPDCANLTTRDNEYDGCSVPDWLVAEGQDKDNPAGGDDSEFSDKRIHGTQPQGIVPTKPCDVHDKCYQTCGSNRLDCDRQLVSEAHLVCLRSKVRGRRYMACLDAVEQARQKLSLGSLCAFRQRQEDYCACCPGQPATVRQKADVTVTFMTGSAELDPQAKKVVDDFAAAHHAVLAGTSYTLTLVGQGSRLGGDKRNMELSDGRIAAVRTVIEASLADPAMPLAGTIIPVSLGEQLAAKEVPRDPEADSQEHRTVQLILIWP